MASSFSGMGMNLGNLSRLSRARTRSISPENRSGAKGKGGMDKTGVAAEAARDLGPGWKMSPFIVVEPGETIELADIKGSGAIQQIWLTTAGAKWRNMILCAYWDGQKHPSVEAPLGDFFCCGWESYAKVTSLPVCVNPGRAFNCYWEMPFRKRARLTLTNRGAARMMIFFQINYVETEVPADAAYFHAQFRRVNPLPYKQVYTVLDGVRGHGQYVGTYMAWGVNNSGWWGEGEIKFFLDGDTDYPTICGTGTEDYFCGAFNFDPGVVERAVRKDPLIKSEYVEFNTPYAGLAQVVRPDGVYESQQRFGMYRWHVMDPVRFEKDLRITIQALGWRKEEKRRYLPLQDDIASVAFWYQTLPTAPFPELPSDDYLDIA